MGAGEDDLVLFVWESGDEALADEGADLFGGEIGDGDDLGV